jgi:hypothetical protein
MLKRLILCCLLALPAFAASAQTSAPIILWSAGDLYAVDPNNPSELPRRLTEDGTISDPVMIRSDTDSLLSLFPSGAVAYRSLPAFARNALDRIQADGFIADFDLPTDLVLYDLATDEQRIIAGQPENASLFVDGAPNAGSVRSAPHWSINPMGEMLVWTEFPFGGNTAVALRYLPAQDQIAPITILNNVPIYDGRAPDIRAGLRGFLVHSALSASGEQRFFIYDASGILLREVRVVVSDSESLIAFDWLDFDTVGFMLDSARWFLIDVNSGAVSEAAQPVVLLSQTAISMSKPVRFGVDPDLGLFWEIQDIGDPTLPSYAFPGAPDRLSLAPGGRSLAFIGFPSFGAAAIWHGDGTIAPIAGTGLDGLLVGAVLWGSMTWSIR